MKERTVASRAALEQAAKRGHGRSLRFRAGGRRQSLDQGLGDRQALGNSRGDRLVERAVDQQPDFRSGAIDERVGADRRRQPNHFHAPQELRAVEPELRGRVVEAAEDPFREIVRRGVDLRADRPARAADEAVGERPTRVEVDGQPL